MDPIADFRAAEERLLARYALEAKEHSVDLREPAVTARFLDAGKGRAILYVHGGGAFGSLWAPMAAALPSRRHILPDRPGFVLTPWVDLRGVDFRRHAVAFLSGLLDRLHLDCVDIVANSMGALWSLWLALDAPNRVRTLALLGAPALTAGGSAPLPMRLLGVPLIGPLMMAMEPPSPKQVRTLWRRMGTDPERLDAAVLDAMLAAEKVPIYATAWRALMARISTLTGVAADCTLSAEELSKVRCPTLLVWGRNDPFGDISLGEHVAAAIPGARFLATDAGHLPWLDATTTCSKAVSELIDRLQTEAVPQS